MGVNRNTNLHKVTDVKNEENNNIGNRMTSEFYAGGAF